MTLVSHSFQLRDLVIVSLAEGGEMRGVVTALLQHDRLQVRLSDELVVSAPADDCRLASTGNPK